MATIVPLLCVATLSAMEKFFPAAQAKFQALELSRAAAQQGYDDQERGFWFVPSRVRPYLGYETVPMPAADGMLETLGRYNALPAELKARLLDYAIGDALQARKPETIPGLPAGYRVCAGAFSPHENVLAVIPHHSYIAEDEDAAVPHLIDLKSKRDARLLWYSRFYPSLSFNAQGNILAVAGWGGEGVVIFPVTTETKTVRPLTWVNAPGTGPVYKFQPSFDVLVYRGKRNQIRFAGYTLNGQKAFHPGREPVRALAVTEGGDIITYQDRQLKVWATQYDFHRRTRLVHTVPLEHEGHNESHAGHSLSLSPDRGYCTLIRPAANGGELGVATSNITLYDARSWKWVGEVDEDGWIRDAVFFDRSGKTFAYALQNGTIVQRTVPDGKVLHKHLEDNAIGHASFTRGLSKAFVCDMNGSNPRIIYPFALAILKKYFSEPRPYDQQLLVWLLGLYHNFINTDSIIEAARMKKLGLTDRAQLKPINAILINQFVEWLNGIVPQLTLKDLNETRDTLPRACPHDARRALALLFDIHVRRH